MGVPKLRFKADDGSDFPDWTFRTFGSVVEEFNDRTTTENEDVLLSCAIDGMYLNSELFGHQRGASNIGYKKITKGALILSMQNLHLGNANVNTRFEHGIVSPAYKTFHIVGCLTEFMSAWVKRHAARKFFYDATTVGASQCRRNVDWEELYQQTIAVPSPSEQRKIADLLSAVDDVISAQEAEVAAWEKRKKGVMQKLFRQEVRFKADDGSNFPDWEEQKIEDVCVLNPRTEQLDDEFYYMDLGSIDHGKWETPEIVNKVDAPSRAQRVAAIDDVFFQSVRPYNMGHYHYVAAKDKQVVASTGYIQARMRNGSNAFLYQLFYEERFNAEVNARCTGSNYPAINSRKFGEITVALPSLPEQRKIADCLSALDDVIIKAKNELAKWQELKKGLLQQMFV